ncbi:hypothetical protein BC629DRAFT_1590338 [Irpex lacteus]|nr:hypothetical protein BC629DRAFT_1590338 [Irpex lacteus]
MEARRLKISTPLVALLVRDGTAYFAILTIINILIPIANDIPSLVNLDLAASFLTTLVPIIICRFILNLRQLDASESSEDSRNLSVSIQFAGNLGGSLHTDIDGGDDENDSEDMDDLETSTNATYISA